MPKNPKKTQQKAKEKKKEIVVEAPKTADLAWDILDLFNKAFPFIEKFDVSNQKRKFPTCENFHNYCALLVQLNKLPVLKPGTEAEQLLTHNKYLTALQQICDLVENSVSEKDLDNSATLMMLSLIQELHEFFANDLNNRSIYLLTESLNLEQKNVEPKITYEHILEQIRLGLRFLKLFKLLKLEIKVGSEEKYLTFYAMNSERQLTDLKKPSTPKEVSNNVVGTFEKFLRDYKKTLPQWQYYKSKAHLAFYQNTSIEQKKDSLIKFKNAMQEIESDLKSKLECCNTLSMLASDIGDDLIGEHAKTDAAGKEKQHALLKQALFYYQLACETMDEVIHLRKILMERDFPADKLEKDKALRDLLELQKRGIERTKKSIENKCVNTLAKNKTVKLAILNQMQSHLFNTPRIDESSNQLLITLHDAETAQILLNLLYARGVNCRIDKDCNPMQIIFFNFDDVSIPCLKTAIAKLDALFPQSKEENKSKQEVSAVDESKITQIEVEDTNGLLKQNPLKTKEAKPKEETIKDKILQEQAQKVQKPAKIIHMKSKEGQVYTYKEADPDCQVYKLYGLPRQYVTIDPRLFSELAENHPTVLKTLTDLCRNGTILFNTKGRSGWTISGKPFAEYSQGLDIDFRKPDPKNISQKTEKNDVAIFVGTENDIRGKNPGFAYRFFGQVRAWQQKPNDPDLVYNCFVINAVKLTKQTKK